MRLIDADKLLAMTDSYKNELGRLKADPFVKSGIKTVEGFINELDTTDVIPIPEGATNGDIFTSIYKPYKVQEHTLCVSIYQTEHDFKQGIEWLVFVSSWWDAPYKADNKNKQGLAYADQDTLMSAT